MALGLAKIDITANLAPLKKGLATARGLVGTMVKSAGSILKSGFTTAFNVIGAGLRRITRLAKIAAAALLGIGIASVKIASDVQETDNLFRISMGSMADEASDFAREYSRSLGLFENDTRKALSTFQLMLTSMGIGERQAFEMAKSLTTLANDIASFRNQKPEEVFLKLQAGITGEAEPLKRLGILVNDTIIKQLAMEDATIQARMAVKGASKELTEAEKVLFRYQAIVNATQRDQGDMARTIDDTANVFRVMWAQIKTTANTIGTALLPVVTKIAIALRDWLINNQPLFERFAMVAANALGTVVKWLNITFSLLSQGRFKEVFAEIGRLFGILVDRMIDMLMKFTPIAFRFGAEAGKAFASAFMQEIEGTALGFFLKGAGGVVKAGVKVAETTGNIGASIAKPFLVPESRQARLSPSAQATWDAYQAQQLEQLRLLNKNITDQRRDF